MAAAKPQPKKEQPAGCLPVLGHLLTIVLMVLMALFMLPLAIMAKLFGGR